MVTKKKAVKKLQPYEIGELDHYLFGQGNHYEIYKKLGAHEVTAGKKGVYFASGLIYGLMTTENAEMAVNYGAAHGALAMTTPGDTTMASKKEVEAIMGGAGARVQR